jgi:hypothetical protein
MHVDVLLVTEKTFHFTWFVIGQCIVSQLVGFGITCEPLHLPKGNRLLGRAMCFDFVYGLDRRGHLGPKVGKTVPWIVLPVVGGLKALNDGLAIRDHFHGDATGPQVNKAHGQMLCKNRCAGSLQRNSSLEGPNTVSRNLHRRGSSHRQVVVPSKPARPVRVNRLTGIPAELGKINGPAIDLGNEIVLGIGRNGTRFPLNEFAEVSQRPHFHGPGFRVEGARGEPVFHRIRYTTRT